jgi:hypothetical protein
MHTYVYVHTHTHTHTRIYIGTYCVHAETVRTCIMGNASILNVISHCILAIMATDSCINTCMHARRLDGQIVARGPSGSADVLSIAVHPRQASLVTCGAGHVSFMHVSGKRLVKVPANYGTIGRAQVWHTYAHSQLYIYIYIYIYNLCVYIHASKHVHKHACIQYFTDTYTYTYTHTYIYIHTHKHTHTHDAHTHRYIPLKNKTNAGLHVRSLLHRPVPWLRRRVIGTGHRVPGRLRDAHGHGRRLYISLGRPRAQEDDIVRAQGSDF